MTDRPSERAAPPERAHLHALTGLRFVAAFHVVAYHGSGYIEGLIPDSLGLLRNLLRTGYSGVNMFFVLSGFILAYTYLERQGGRPLELRRFYVARFARIYPLYLLGMVIVAPLVVMHFLQTNPVGTALAKIALSGGVALVLTQSWTPLTAIWNPPGWTLSVEAFYYAVFPILGPRLWRLSRRAAMKLAGVVWLAGLLPAAVGMVLVPDVLLATKATAHGGEGWPSWLVTLPVLRLPEFVLGILLARLFVPGADRSARPSPRAANLVVTAGCALTLTAFLVAHLVPRAAVNAGLFDPVFALVIVGLAHSRGWIARLLGTRPLVVLGEASYGIYLLHIPILQWLRRFVAPEWIESNGPTFFALWAVLVLIASIAAFYGIEHPARIWIRNHLGRILRGPAMG